MNELSLLRGFLFAASFLFRSLLLSCHIVLLLYFSGYDHKILCLGSSCGLEKTAHNILLYKLNSIRCQYFITFKRKYFLPLERQLAVDDHGFDAENRAIEDR